MSSEKLAIVIEVDSKSGEARLREVDRALSRLDKDAEKASGSLGGLTKALVSSASAYAAFRTASNLIDAFARQEQAVASLNSALESMGRTTPDLSKKLQALASEIQSRGIIGDEEIIRGQAFLVTYSDISDKVLPRATKVMADLAAKMGGDIVSAANMVGKASMGMTGELSRMGITLSEEAKKTKDFELILRDIESQVGGVNEALSNTASGAMKQFHNAMGDAKEQLGGVLAYGLLPTVKELTALVTGMTEASSSADVVREKGAELALLFAKLADAIGNAARGISLPFEAVGGAVGALAAQIDLVMHGEFRAAMQVGSQYVNDMKKKFDELTDPKVVNRFEEAARKMLKAASSPKNAATAPSPTTVGGGETALAAEEARKIIDIHSAKWRAIQIMADAAYSDEQSRLLAAQEAKFAALDEERQRMLEALRAQITDKERLRQAEADLNAYYDDLKMQQAQQTADRLYQIAQEEEQRRLQLIADSQNQALSLQQNFAQVFQDASRINLDQLSAQMQAFVVSSHKLWDQSWRGKLQVTQGALRMMSSLMASHDRKQFEIGKAAAIANAVVSTAQGAAQALEWGWPLGPVFAGIIAAAGAAQIATISRTRFGQGSGSVGVPAAGVGGGAPTVGINPASGLPAAANTPPPAQQAPQIHVTIKSDTGYVDPQAVQTLAESLQVHLDQLYRRGAGGALRAA